jgi:hypothetical protein
MPHALNKQRLFRRSRTNIQSTRGERAAVQEGHPSKVWAMNKHRITSRLHRPKFLRGGCLDGSAAAATATKERHTEAEIVSEALRTNGAQQSRPMRAKVVRRRWARAARGACAWCRCGAELQKTKGWPAPGGAGRAERGPGWRPATKEHPKPRGAGGAEREGRAILARRTPDIDSMTRSPEPKRGPVGCSASLCGLIKNDSRSPQRIIEASDHLRPQRSAA